MGSKAKMKIEPFIQIKPQMSAFFCTASSRPHERRLRRRSCGGEHPLGMPTV